VGHAGRHLAQAFDAAQGLCEGEDAGELAEALCGGVAAPDAEAQHAATHGVTVLLLGDGAVGVGVKARVIDGDDVGVSLEGRGDGSCIFGGLPGAQVQRLHAAVGEPAVKGRRDGTDCVLQEGEACAQVIAVEGGDAHDDVRVAIDILCDAVDDNIGAVVEWVLDVRAHEGVVDDDHDAVGVGGGGDLADVDEAQGGVGGALDPDQPGGVGDVLADVDLDGRGEGDLDAVGLGDLGEVAVGAAVDVRDGDDMRAGGQALQDVGGGGAARGVGEGILGVLYGGDGRLEVGPVGIATPAVLVLAYWLSHRVLGKGGGQGDGLNDGAGGRVMWRPGVDGEGAEALDRGGGTGRSLYRLFMGIAGDVGVAVEDRDGHDCSVGCGFVAKPGLLKSGEAEGGGRVVVVVVVVVDDDDEERGRGTAPVADRKGEIGQKVGRYIENIFVNIYTVLNMSKHPM
jgi:hypothetical protein